MQMHLVDDAEFHKDKFSLRPHVRAFTAHPLVFELI
jgi:hypothetical protein